MKKKRNSVSKFENIRQRILIFKTWYKIIFPFNRWFRGIQHMRLRNGKSIYVRSVHPSCPMDVSITSDVLGSNEYELKQLQQRNIETVVDLGANIGTFSMEMHRMFPLAKILAYEPHPENCFMFRINAPFATLVQKAVSGARGTAHLEDTVNHVGLRLIEKGGIEVETEKLDDILKDIQKVDLLKIDIEGSEYETLNNTSSHTFNKIQAIIMEVHDFGLVPNHMTWAEDILSKHGFKTSWIIGGTSVIHGEK